MGMTSLRGNLVFMNTSFGLTDRLIAFDGISSIIRLIGSAIAIIAELRPCRHHLDFYPELKLNQRTLLWILFKLVSLCLKLAQCCAPNQDRYDCTNFALCSTAND